MCSYLTQPWRGLRSHKKTFLAKKVVFTIFSYHFKVLCSESSDTDAEGIRNYGKHAVQADLGLTSILAKQSLI